ncbi:hypothetical protein [Actinomadura opuntiae]|uniref:hypothetical protein n=1 Tax=Actinomadura sp. OS1-43 TaxID=604315 RepID=UPI00255B2392|nr:hypothetical protein [Actinomadura sp. OS1-43]MDL4813393.1 hypothetical protein [Actinomadura sp. OS1-43]
MALSAPAIAAHAATTTWKVVNPAADGKYTTASTGTVTIKNQAGATLLTCTSVQQWGQLASRTVTGATASLGTADGTVGSPCTRPGGSTAVILGTLAAGVGPIYYTATGYNAATGTTTLSGAQSSPYGITIFADDCRFSFGKITASYDNATQILKYGSAVATPFATANNDGSVGCAGVRASGETITFTGEFKVSPAIKITRTTG